MNEFGNEVIQKSPGKIHLSFYLEPEEAENVLSLCLACLSPQSSSDFPAALPAALVRVAKWVSEEVASIPHPSWNQATIEVMSAFVRTMLNYEQVLKFNYLDWEERFLDELYGVTRQDDNPQNEKIYSAIKSVVNQIKCGVHTYSQKKVYFSDNIPMPFDEWAKQIIDGEVALDDIRQAHNEMIDAEQLKRLLDEWCKKNPTSRLAF